MPFSVHTMAWSSEHCDSPIMTQNSQQTKFPVLEAVSEGNHITALATPDSSFDTPPYFLLNPSFPLNCKKCHVFSCSEDS
jgi:hypothetical protein